MKQYKIITLHGNKIAYKINDNTRQDKTRHDKITQHNIIQDNIRQYRAIQEKNKTI